MRFLVDSNVLSEATKPNPEPRVLEWIEVHERDLVVDSIILGEILTGIVVSPAGKRRRQLDQWFTVILETIVCLPWNSIVAQRWAVLLADLRGHGREMPILDGMIAATALTHDLTVATRNVRDFRNAGVRIVDPFR